MQGGSGAWSYEHHFQDLTEVVLEESWVLDFRHTRTELVFELDAVLTPEHGQYRMPPPHEVECYRRSRLTIRSTHPIVLEPSAALPAVDATGTVDYGHIDVFRRVCQNDGLIRWELDGDWGHAWVVDPQVELESL